MTENAYQHLRQFDDPAKPHKRVWLCPATGVHAKTHAVAMSLDFGRIGWRISGSYCDSQGKAFAHGDGFTILAEPPHEFTAQVDGSIGTPEEMAARLRADFERELRFVVAKVENAVLIARAAMSLAAGA